MAIEIPDIADAHCLIMSACGDLLTDDKKILDWFKKQERWRVAHVQLPSGVFLVRLGMGGKTNGKHCHFDVAAAAYFDDEPPKADSTIAKLQEVVAPLAGLKADVLAKGRFIEDFASMEPFVKTMTKPFGPESRPQRIRFTGVTMAVENSPVQSLSWELAPKEDKIRIEVKARLQLEMTDDYLLNALRLLKMGKSILVANEETP